MTARHIPISAVLFDIGMTILHPNGEVMAEELARAGHLGVEPGETEKALFAVAECHHIDYPVGLERAEKVGALWGHLLGAGDQAGAKVWAACNARGDLYSNLDPDAVAVLKHLREHGVRVAAVSNSDGTLPAELDTAGIGDLFDVVLDSAHLGTEKPDPGIFHRALAETGCAAEQAVFVGDGLVNDILGARLAGITRTVLYDRHGLHRPLPVPVIRRLAELPPLLALDLWPSGGDRCASA